jgi:hypothetical protein
MRVDEHVFCVTADVDALLRPAARRIKVGD